MKKNSGTFCQVWALAVLCGTAGCDLGTYSQRYNDRVSKMQSMAITNKDLSKDAVAIGNVAKVRLPSIFLIPDASANYGPSDDFLKARVPAMDFPGFITSYIGDKESGGLWLPVQGYFYSVKAGDQSASDLQSEISAVIKATLPSASPKWENLPVEGYDGITRAWSSMTITGTQPFLVAEQDGEKQKNLTGRMDLYLVSSETAHFLFILRSPAEVFDESLALGTIKSLHDF